jgi:hypothetical protein
VTTLLLQFEPTLTTPQVCAVVVAVRATLKEGMTFNWTKHDAEWKEEAPEAEPCTTPQPAD